MTTHPYNAPSGDSIRPLSFAFLFDDRKGIIHDTLDQLIFYGSHCI